MIAEFIDTNDQRWHSVLKVAPHDIYHLPQYIKFSGKHENGEPIAFYAEDKNAIFLAPLLIRKIPKELDNYNNRFDLTTPYGYPSPVFFPKKNSILIRDYLNAFRKVCAEKNIVSAFFRLHPLLPLNNNELMQYGTLVNHGQTVYIDLRFSLDELWIQTRHNHRRDIRKLIRAGFHVTMNNWHSFDRFINLYMQTMKRVNASKFYLFPYDYFIDLKTALEDKIHLCFVISPDDDIAAGGLFSEEDGIVQYHLGATSSKYLREAPSKLMFDFMRKWAKERNNKNFHLGGGVGGNSDDSLFRFKAGFSNLRSNFYTYRIITNDYEYNILYEMWKKINKIDKDFDCNFFPIYRKSIENLFDHK